MKGNRLAGVWAGKDWNLHKYAWRGSYVKSPWSGQNMRAIVAMDDRGKYHPGVRNGEPRDPNCKTLYQDFTSYKDKGGAIAEAKGMLQDTVDNHQQMRTYVDKEGLGATDNKRSHASSLMERATTDAKEAKAVTPSPGRGRAIAR